MKQETHALHHTALYTIYATTPYCTALRALLHTAPPFTFREIVLYIPIKCVGVHAAPCTITHEYIT